MDIPKPSKPVETITAPSPYSLAILRGLQGRNVYQGTVPAKVVKGRRAANKVARASRRNNRRTGA